MVNYLCRPLHSSPHEYFIFKVKTSWIHTNNMIFAHIYKYTHIIFLLKVVLAGAFYPNYFTWKISDEELSLRQMSGLDPTTTVMVSLWLYGFSSCAYYALLLTVVRVTTTRPPIQSIAVPDVWYLWKRKGSSF